MKKCLSIAGSDCSGGAGIQADLKAFSALGTFGMSVVTSVVAENTGRVISVHNVPVAEIENQIDAVFEDIEVDSVKLGMLPTAEIIKAVADKLKEHKPPVIVCDPVMVATSGDALSDGSTAQALRDLIFPIADIITPNIPEAEAFTGMKITDIADMEKAAYALAETGVKNVLLKGGHLDGDAVDLLLSGGEMHILREKRVDSPNTHGTGCTLSSAIAANLANGMELTEAVTAAKRYITEAIEKSFYTGRGHGPVNHFYEYYGMKGIE